jgi:predicted phosphodiesterase
MNILAISDIHNNVAAVRRMRSLERNCFDVIIIAGDIGSDHAETIFKVLQSFKCPILYVYGNWDRKLSYKASFGADCHFLHLNFVKIKSLTFTGFSGCPTHWGRNPIAMRSLRKDRRTTSNDINELNRQALKRLIKKSNIDLSRTVLITHERHTRVREIAPNVALHLFGHIHAHSDSTFAGTRYVNVAALDCTISARPRGKRKWTYADCRNYNAGNYTIINFQNDGNITSRCVYLPHDYKRWVPLERMRLVGQQLIPEERKLARLGERGEKSV